MLLLAAAALGAAAAHNPPPGWRRVGAARPGETHEVMFGVRQRQEGLRAIEARLLAAEPPPHLTLDGVGTLVRDEAAQAGLRQWLAAAGASVTAATPAGEFVRARASVEVWEQQLGGQFLEFEAAAPAAGRALRCPDCSLPAALEPHVSALFNSQTLPPVPPPPRPHAAAPTPPAGPFIDPAKLFRVYNLSQSETRGDPTLGQGVVGLGITFDPHSVELFQQRFLPAADLPPVSVVMGGNGSYPGPAGAGGEADLDLEYLMAVSQGTPTSFFFIPGSGGPSVEDPMLAFLELAASLAAPPEVLSISYGEAELVIDPQVVDALNTEAMKLGARGVTIVTASGDDGVLIPPARQHQSWHGVGPCAYVPGWPDTSPFITVVGATQGHELPSPRPDQIIACQSSKAGGITTGGGFSAKVPRPTWQDDAVEGYLNSEQGRASAKGFVSTGRAYPDISMAGHSFVIVAGNESSVGSGTSVSAPVFAGFVSLINARRKERGMQSVGFINPTLYRAGRAAFRDIVDGENNCAAGHNMSSLVCCEEGFRAAVGWDPLTGVGEPLSWHALASLFAL